MYLDKINWWLCVCVFGGGGGIGGPSASFPSPDATMSLTQPLPAEWHMAVMCQCKAPIFMEIEFVLDPFRPRGLSTTRVAHICYFMNNKATSLLMYVAFATLLKTKIR